MNKPLVIERVREALDYDPLTGVLTWKVGAFKGRPAGSLRPDGYLRVAVDDVDVYAHVLIWFYVTGEWPADQVDHRNMNRSDNSWDNLRPSSAAQNKQNSRVRADSSTGLKGVFLRPKCLRKKYQAKITVNGRQRSLGYFADPQEAHAAYCAAASAHYGEFARFN